MVDQPFKGGQNASTYGKQSDLRIDFVTSQKGAHCSRSNMRESAVTKGIYSKKEQINDQKGVQVLCFSNFGAKYHDLNDFVTSQLY